jgi:hypothetical protein
MARTPRLRPTKSDEHPFSEAERQAILASIKLREGITPDEFLACVERVARWGGNMDAMMASRREPSIRERKHKRVADLAAMLYQALQEQLPDDDLDAPIPIPDDLVGAALDLAEEGHPPPSFMRWMPPASHLLNGEPQWKIRDVLREVRQSLAWLEPVARRAAAKAGREKAGGGNREAKSLDFCVKALVGIFNKCSAHKAQAYKNGYTYEAHGNLIEFLDRVLRPLGFEGNSVALVRRIEKARANGKRARRISDARRRAVATPYNLARPQDYRVTPA